jgi:molybdopterin-guanine dinucleotide biosynthesis protein A
LRTEVLELLARRADGRDGAVPVVGGFLEPLVAVYRREAGLRRFAHELETGVGKVSNALGHMDICRVEETELREVDDQLLSFWNVNSKEDLRKAEDMIRQGVAPL